MGRDAVFSDHKHSRKQPLLQVNFFLNILSFSGKSRCVMIESVINRPGKYSGICEKGKIMIRKAADFAKRAHEGTFRKGSRIPYIYHPMEVALIVAQMTDDEEVIAAAYLHDVLEDTEVTPGDLLETFGSRILNLVQSETEDKSRTWRERKESTVIHLAEAAREVKLLALGDKLSNLRSTARDYMVMGDEVWQRFNEKRRESHQWYLEGILTALKDLSDLPAYRELQKLYEFIYGA